MVVIGETGEGRDGHMKTLLIAQFSANLQLLAKAEMAVLWPPHAKS